MSRWFRRQFEKQQQTQHLWLDSFDQFSESILLLDENFNVMRYNHTWQHFIESIFPRQQQEIPLHFILELKRYIYPDDLYTVTQLLNPHHKNTEHGIRLIHQQQLFWFKLRCQHVYDLQQATNYYYFFLTEQTHQIKQASLRLAQQRSLDGLLQRLPIMLYRSRNDRNWTMEYVNEGCQQITGYLPEQLINSPLYGQRIYPADNDYVWSSVQQALDHKQIFYLTYRWRDAYDNLIQVKEIGQGLYSESDMVLGVEGVIFKDMDA
ncbi:PAS domain-containing protein [Acinetobacter puyangensis]|uniref:PAS domain-containing protein n=1 Tax=Acinetobacter puyangensis TaxID=1096779 RepID=UPI003A4E098E